LDVWPKWPYIQVMRCLYESATMSVQVQNQQTKPVSTIATRSKTRGRHLLDAVHKCNDGYVQDAELERTCHQHKGEYISYLRYADDIVIMAETLQDLQPMLNDLANSSVRIGLRYYLNKSMVMFNEQVLPEPVAICEPFSKLFKKISISGKHCS
jgi:hypothetical protein